MPARTLCARAGTRLPGSREPQDYPLHVGWGQPGQTGDFPDSDTRQVRLFDHRVPGIPIVAGLILTRPRSRGGALKSIFQPSRRAYPR